MDPTNENRRSVSKKRSVECTYSESKKKRMVCPHCHLETHSRISSLECLKNPKNPNFINSSSDHSPGIHPKLCKSCNSSTHLRVSSLECPNNPKNLQKEQNYSQNGHISNFNSPQISLSLNRLQLSPSIDETQPAAHTLNKRVYNKERYRTIRTNLNDTFRMVNRFLIF